MKTYSPCKECTERYPGCHGKCAMYVTWRENEEKQKAHIRKEKNKVRELDELLISSRNRGKRRRDGSK